MTRLECRLSLNKSKRPTLLPNLANSENETALKLIQSFSKQGLSLSNNGEMACSNGSVSITSAMDSKVLIASVAK